MEGYDSRKTPNVRVTVLEDPNNSLQELFNPASQKQQVPLHQRKLPKSFFVPPTTNEPLPKDFVISHSKANSSPACLDVELCANITPNVPVHSHQKSLECAAKYNQGFNQEASFRDICPGGFLQTSRDTNAPPFICRRALGYAISDLPSGYDLAINENNQVYFLNHQTQDTTWFDPRIPEKYQKWGMTLEELQQVHINYARQFLCGSPPILPLCGAQVDRVSPTASSTPSAVSPSSGMHGQSRLSNAPSPSAQPNPSTLTPTLAVLCTASPVSSLPQNVPVGVSPSRMRISGQSAQASHRTHPAQLPHSHLHHAREQPPVTDVQHQRQHSHGQTAPTPPPTQTLVTHFRSCSQPVSMSTGRDRVSVSGLTTSNISGSSRPNNQPPISQLSGMAGGGLSTSSSLIGLSMASTPTGQLIGETPLQNAQIGSTTANSSSGQLVQGLECLRLNTSSGSITALGGSPQLLESQQQQQIQHAQFMLPTNTAIGTNTGGGGGGRFSGVPLTTSTAAATQHSHQGSMDSGVGQSLTGQSSASANQTPEHTVMLFCDPGVSECNTENMEGISYPNEELGCTAFNVFDNIDISDISA
ncbi:unnamed protein product [Calicophoron daubneyi]|uniref:WW domain-containing protein n=1 Tax=Calicophoron daubneyi TaxID=300641 RepID=A0AAV2TAU2_CALDB